MTLGEALLEDVKNVILYAIKDGFLSFFHAILSSFEQVSNQCIVIMFNIYNNTIIIVIV